MQSKTATVKPTIAIISADTASGKSAAKYNATSAEGAGFPVTSEGNLSDELIDNLVVSGDEIAVAVRLKTLLDSGLDELLVWGVFVSDRDAEQARLANLIGGL